MSLDKIEARDRASAAADAAALDVETLERVALAVPDHLILTGWLRTKNPVFGEWQIYADDGRGMGRQHIAVTPALKSYGFTDLSEFIATFDPPTVLRLLAAVKAGRAAELPADVVRLVVAARVVAFETQSREALKELDEASEAFASRVPWAFEPCGAEARADG